MSPLLTALADRLVVALIVLLAVAAVAFMWFVPKRQAAGWVAKASAPDDKRAELENAARATLVQFFGGIALLLALIATLTQIVDARKASERTLRQTIAQQMSSQFTEAVAQLASSALEVRLAGIYSLERLAKDSEDRRETIVPLMLAYMRSRHPVGSPERTAVLKGLERRVAADGSGKYEPACKSPYANAWQDTQAALNLVLRFPVVAQKDFDLRRADLIGVVVEDGANFMKADLHEASLAGAHLEGARFDHAELFDASLMYACVRRATFDGVDRRSVDQRAAEGLVP